MIAGEVDFLSAPVLHEVERFCQKRQIELIFLPRMIGVSERKATHQRSSPNRLRAAHPSRSSPFFRLKRWIDVVGSLALIVLFFPFCACGCACSAGRRAADFFLAGEAWLEGSIFSDLQISNVKSTVRFGWQSDAG